MFWVASEEGLINNGSSVHAGLRTRLGGRDFADYENDERQGFLRIEADDIDEVGVQGIIDVIMEKMGTSASHPHRPIRPPSGSDESVKLTPICT
jgi:agmatinase